MGTVVGTCMPEIEHHQTTADITTFAPIRRQRYGKFYYGIMYFIILLIKQFATTLRFCVAQRFN